MTKKQKLLKICGILFLVENALILLAVGVFYLSIGLIDNDAPEFIEEMNKEVLGSGNGEWLWRHFSEANRQYYKRTDVIQMVSSLFSQNPNYQGFEIVTHTDHKSRSLRGEPFIRSYYVTTVNYPDYELQVEYDIGKQNGSWSINKFNIRNNAQPGSPYNSGQSLRD
ncbi:hypothetical protein [Pelagicoccus sp. SDUM812002]|uniref:hypothetical protein n=1 Tax=Pelagicoccus sp. SDUM812002 TaxID=3041266 RepID=UPI0028104D96|nr:hypothetical protein [Pelagicoccus sp. SDUM812002]MDQ8188512.1 hypothetical protein [Pelagicoccus sp. SDUM812002]